MLRDMQSLRSPGSWRRAAAALLTVISGCTTAQPQDPPENGQTGSPGVPVPPDYDNPGFRPPAGDPGNPGPTPTFPERPLDPPKQTTLEGSTLYVAQRDRGLLLFDVSDPRNPEYQGALDVSGEPHWVYAEAQRLFVVSRGLEVDTQRVVDCVLMFDLSESTEPAELARFTLEGEFWTARAVTGGLVLMTRIADEGFCDPEYGPNDGWIATQQAQLSRLLILGDEFELSERIAVEGDGYFELPDGYAITRGAEGQSTELRFIAVSPDGELTAFEAAEFEQSILPTAPMQRRDDVLRVFEAAGAEAQLTELQLSAPAQRRSRWRAVRRGRGARRGVVVGLWPRRVG
jgi:hypothetical protein